VGGPQAVLAIIFVIHAAGSNAAAGRGYYNSILGFAAGNVNGPDAGVCNSALRRTVYAATDRNEMS